MAKKNFLAPREKSTSTNGNIDYSLVIMSMFFNTFFFFFAIFKLF